MRVSDCGSTPAPCTKYTQHLENIKDIDDTEATRALLIKMARKKRLALTFKARRIKMKLRDSTGRESGKVTEKRCTV